MCVALLVVPALLTRRPAAPREALAAERGTLAGELAARAVPARASRSASRLDAGLAHAAFGADPTTATTTAAGTAGSMDPPPGPDRGPVSLVSARSAPSASVSGSTARGATRPTKPATSRKTTSTTAPRPPTTTTTAPRRNSQTGGASWYNAPSGTCAHRSLPFGTVLTVINVSTGARTTCTVSDRGPFTADRIIDLARTTFAQIASPSSGVVDVRIEW